MTYCVGWKYENSVYLLADTAITKSDEPATPRSSFGQIHDKVRGQYVEEALLKLVPIAPGIAVAFAGNVQLAGEIIEYLQEKLPFAENFEKLFEFLNLELGPFSPDPERFVELLFAASSKNGNADLLRWDSFHGINSKHSDFYQIGSLTRSDHAVTTFSVKDKLPFAQISTEHFLPILVAIVQSYGIYDNVVDKNVGGVIYGLCSRDGIISWQEDTSYILYNPSFSKIDYISVFVRDNVLVVSSSLTNDTRIFYDSISTLSFKEWRERWETHINEQKISDRYRYWIFISIAEKLITILRREDFERKSRYFAMKYSGNGKFNLRISPELKMRLTENLVDWRNGNLRIFVD